jgi:AcrR family transcriptional regulator
VPRSPEPARQKLLDAALELFAERGIGAISLREIRVAACQSNTAAVQHHFGDKDGLLRALLERELPALVARRKELLVAADDSWSIAAVFVLPFAEMATGPPTSAASCGSSASARASWRRWPVARRWSPTHEAR